MSAESLPMPYEVRAPRTPQEAVAALVRPDATYDSHQLVDAMRDLPRFVDDHRVWVHELVKGVGRIGLSQRGTREETTAVLTHAFGDDGPELSNKLIAIFRTGTVAEMSKVFFLRVALLIQAGWQPSDINAWWDQDTLSKDDLELIAAWCGTWDWPSLRACIRAGLTRDELQAAFDSHTLPDPADMALLIALRART